MSLSRIFTRAYSGLIPQAPQVVGFLESSPKLYLESSPKFYLPARVYYTKDIAEDYFKKTQPQFKTLTAFWNAKLNQEAVENFKYNALIRSMQCNPEDPENLEAFKRYMLQDFWWLVEYYKFKEQRLKSITKPDSGSYAAEVAGLARLKSYIDNDFKQMLAELGIDHLIGQTKPNKATQAYLDWMMKLCGTESYYVLNLITSPCGYGWSVLAQDLFNDPKTVKKGPLYTMFVVPNTTDYYDYEVHEVGDDGIPISKIVSVPIRGGFSSTAKKVSEFLDFRIRPDDYSEERGNQLFREGLGHETNMFNACREKPPKEDL